MSIADRDNSYDQLPISIKPGSTKCSICGEESDGYHFGAEACRACAAFFRRTVSLGKNYICRYDGKCQTTADIRCICRACRYSKCMTVGMNPAGVQHRRDSIKKHRKSTSPTLLSLKQEDEPSSSSSISSCIISSSESMPTLERMRESYTKLENSRVVIHRREGESLIMPRIPRKITYKESAQVLVKEVPLVVDWVENCFDEYSNLPNDQKQILYGNFYLQFMMLQGAYFCSINNREDVLIIASGDHVDVNNLLNFFHDEDAAPPQLMSSEEAVELFRNSISSFIKSVVRTMIQQKVDIYEFFALSSCVLWDFGLEGQSDECKEIGKNIKEKVLKELLFYLQNVRKIDDASIRIAILVTLLPALNRSVKRFQENIEFSKFFNIFKMPDQVYKIIDGKFI